MVEGSADGAVSLPFPPGDDPASWEPWIDAIGPASMLVLIRSRMGPLVRDDMAPEDVWQETLLRAWRSRAQFEWRGQKSFRRWLAEIAERCIWDASHRASAEKRGGGERERPWSTLAAQGSTDGSPGQGLALTSTTPSRLALHREQSVCMQQALEALPDDVREVVRLRLFDDLTSEEVAARLALTVAAVKHRFRKGGAEYRHRLSVALASRSDASAPRAKDA